MKIKRNEEISQREKQWKLSFQPVVRYILWFCMLMLLAELGYGIFHTIETMKDEARVAQRGAQAQIEARLDHTIHLLTSLSQDSWYRDPSISYMEKSQHLKNFSTIFGYMMIRIVDQEAVVYNEKGPSANLGSRDYMQRMFATGEAQVTDSFAAGADGKTLNYTIAVPFLDQGKVTGGLFAAIYFDELNDILTSCTYGKNQEMVLFGTQNQVMSDSKNGKYGQTYLNIAQKGQLFGTTAKTVEEQMFNKQDGAHWGVMNGDFLYSTYAHIANTGWTVMCKSSFWGTFLSFLPQLLAMMLLSGLLCGFFILLARRFITAQMATVDMLVDSVQALERKIYQNEKPNEVDFKEIISLTGKGLTDGLTGVITRTVFLSQLKPRLAVLDPQQVAALCFVDVDNLKALNDDHGHMAGDMALKSVGYVLREYEKKHDGLVGRYGGDEFILFISQVENRATLENLLDELAIRLHAEVSTGEVIVPMHCSIGVAICHPKQLEVERLIEQADEALYNVKQNGKGTYRIYEDK